MLITVLRPVPVRHGSRGAPFHRAFPPGPPVVIRGRARPRSGAARAPPRRLVVAGTTPTSPPWWCGWCAPSGWTSRSPTCRGAASAARGRGACRTAPAAARRWTATPTPVPLMRDDSGGVLVGRGEIAGSRRVLVRRDLVLRGAGAAAGGRAGPGRDRRAGGPPGRAPDGRTRAVPPRAPAGRGSALGRAVQVGGEAPPWWTGCRTRGRCPAGRGSGTRRTGCWSAQPLTPAAGRVPRSRGRRTAIAGAASADHASGSVAGGAAAHGRDGGRPDVLATAGPATPGQPRGASSLAARRPARPAHGVPAARGRREHGRRCRRCVGGAMTPDPHTRGNGGGRAVGARRARAAARPAARLALARGGRRRRRAAAGPLASAAATTGGAARHRDRRAAHRASRGTAAAAGGAGARRVPLAGRAVDGADELATGLDLDVGELAWFADPGGWLRTVPDGPLQHYRRRWITSASGTPAAAGDARAAPGGAAAPGRAEGARPRPRPPGGARVRPRPLPVDPRGGAHRPPDGAAAGPGGLLRARHRRAGGGAAARGRLSRRGRHDARRAAGDRDTPAILRAAPAADAAGGSAPPAPHPARRPAPPPGRADRRPRWRTCWRTGSTAASPGSPPRSTPGTAATPTTWCSPATSRPPGSRPGGEIAAEEGFRLRDEKDAE